jgi:ABC-type polar amino acid transport system ATPase subunit
MITFTDVHKWFGPFHVLKEINLQIERGEVVVICGPSGSGKSTLIRTINGIEPIQQGQLTVDGQSLTDPRLNIFRLRADIGMVFQHFNLFPHMTVAQNVMLGPLKVRRLGAEAARERAYAALEKVGLRTYTERYPNQLSGGQQQRVAIARALAMEPKILLFDEPTSALDPELINEVLDVIVQLASEGRSMVVVSHEMNFTRKMAHRCVFMDHGRVVEVATPAEFFSEPRTERARQFLSQILH